MIFTEVDLSLWNEVGERKKEKELINVTTNNLF
jgi:hypothetical protein